MTPEEIRAQADTFAEFLLGLPKRRSRKGEKVSGRCPTTEHEDKRPSFSYNIEMDAWACSCGNGKGSELRQRLGFQSQVMTNPGRRSTDRVLVDRYVYEDEKGKPLYRVNRYSPKAFDQERFDNGNWVGGAGCLDGVRRVLYRLPEVLAFRNKKPLLVVEGEKDADTAWYLGFPATTAPHGASAKWKREFNIFLKGKDVVVIPDKDEPGVDHALDVAESLKKDGISARIVELPGDTNDLSKWVEGGGTSELLDELVGRRLPSWEEVTGAKILKAEDLAAI